ncbi:hypothetical protein A7J71_11720 [Achromobacter insolitus]|uniref:DUF3261 domain-containing protein n=1 Tax=Achromobacter insolitus TaxID=217204 RepID=UPI0007C68461|nr:DUF3261 domain-containing protein [Achromobacter insolitus]OAE72678.1 hypothetical protein A7J71_11720 [Achromobacter insolitus]OCZ57356.1 hypothetical protein A7P22_19080 [Achromobacter insolitus]
MAATRSSFLSAARTLGALLALALLAGCAGAPPVPARDADFQLPRQLHVVQSVAGQPALNALLVVQREGTALRWSLFDPMGVPQARQILEQGQWRNDGFLRPNAPARDLFAALFFAWTPEAQLDAAYGADNWRASREDDGAAQRELLERGRPRWSVRWPQAAQTGTFTITTANQVTWRVSPLKEQP